MKHKPDLRLLTRYLESFPDAKKQLAEHLEITPNAIEQWISRRRLPKPTRKFILIYINERLRYKKSVTAA